MNIRFIVYNIVYIMNQHNHTIKVLYSAAVDEYKKYQDYKAKNRCEHDVIARNIKQVFDTEDKLIQEFQTRGVTNIRQLIDTHYTICENDINDQRKNTAKKLHENVKSQWPIIKKQYNQQFKEEYFKIISDDDLMRYNKLSLGFYYPDKADKDIYCKYSPDTNILRYFSFKLSIPRQILKCYTEELNNKNLFLTLNDRETVDCEIYRNLIYFTRSLMFYHIVNHTRLNTKFYYSSIIDGTKMYLNYYNNPDDSKLNIILDRKQLD